ncbi:11115_t:CDS:2 [Dentiscutata erythropus]|uniref:11115_t:CDS:1 n=1 Tax=Dentiscutata erythropus TaxID=1348616 RepID=A0A9N9CTJ2_9GLOM|nr:11115_t:CDS:2 [Dentiscutata erythropus]
MSDYKKAREFSIFDKKFIPGGFEKPLTNLPFSISTINLTDFRYTDNLVSPTPSSLSQEIYDLTGPQFWPTSKPVKKTKFWKKFWSKISNSPTSTNGFFVMRSKRRTSNVSESSIITSHSTEESSNHDFRTNYGGDQATPTSILTTVVIPTHSLYKQDLANTTFDNIDKSFIIRSRHHSISYPLRDLRHPNPTPDEKISCLIQCADFNVHIHPHLLHAETTISHSKIPIQIPRDISFSQFQKSIAKLLKYNLKHSSTNEPSMVIKDKISKDLIVLYHTKRINADDLIGLSKKNSVERNEDSGNNKNDNCKETKENLKDNIKQKIIIQKLIKLDKLWVVDCDQVWRICMLFWKNGIEISVNRVIID